MTKTRTIALTLDYDTFDALTMALLGVAESHVIAETNWFTPRERRVARQMWDRIHDAWAGK